MGRYETRWSSSIKIEGTGGNPKPDHEKTSQLLKLGELNEYIRSVLSKLAAANSQLSSEFILAIENHFTTIATCSTPTLSLRLDPLVEKHPKYVPNAS